MTYESYKYTLVTLKNEFDRKKLKSTKPLDVEHFLQEVQRKKS